MDIKAILSSVGVSGAGVAFLYFLTQSLIDKSEPLSSELLFIILTLAFILIFILAYKMLSKDKSSRDSSVSVGKGADVSGTVNTGDTNVEKQDTSRDSNVNIGKDANVSGHIYTGDTTINNHQKDLPHS